MNREVLLRHRPTRGPAHQRLRLAKGHPHRRQRHLPLHTDFRPDGFYDASNNHIWHASIDPAGNAGFECVDVNGPAPASCAVRFVAAAAGVSQYDNNVSGVANVGRELYSLDLAHNAMSCLNLDGNDGDGAPCAGQPYAGFGGNDIVSVGVSVAGGKVFAVGNGMVKCFDPGTKAACADTSRPRSSK